MAGSPVPMADLRISPSDRENGGDAAQRLLPSGGNQTYRGSLDRLDEIEEQKQRYRDDDDSSTTRAEDLDDPLPPTRRQSYLQRNWRWIALLSLCAFLALACLSLLYQLHYQKPPPPPPEPKFTPIPPRPVQTKPATTKSSTSKTPKPTPTPKPPPQPAITADIIDGHEIVNDYEEFPAPPHDENPPFAKPPGWAIDPSSDLSISGFSGPRDAITFLNGTQFVKPPNMKFIGIIFFGRRQFVNILDCYLRRNLKVNGGLLDEIHFLLHTDVEEDVKWLKNLVKNDNMGDYYKLKTEDTSGNWRLWGTFSDLYKKFMTDKDAIYVKMDDDILFIDDYCIPEMLRATIEHPEAHSIQANIVNNKWNYWHQFRVGTVWPFLADEDKGTKWPENSWRPSELPRWKPEQGRWKGELPPYKTDFMKFPVPNEGHRWLPLDATYENLRHTPMGHELRNPMFKVKPGINGWAVTAQVHMSFFTNIERGELRRYSYGSDYDGLWNQWYSRYNINMMAIRGTYVLKNPVWLDRYKKAKKGDEFLLTRMIPKELDMPVFVATRAIAGHFSFRGEREDMLRTDILDRYRALANELYCEADNYRPRLGQKLGPHHTANVEHPDGDSKDEKIGDGPQDLINDDDGDDKDDNNHN